MSNYFNMGKLAVEKGPKIVRKVKQAIQTTKSPIKQAVETIKATFAKPKKPKIGGTRKSDQIKKSNRMIKDLDKTMEKDMSPELRAKGEKLKKEIKKTQKEVYRTGFKLGKKVEKLGSLKGYNKTVVCYESPYRIVKTIRMIQEVFGDIELSLCRELTKKYEEVTKKKASVWLDYYESRNPKGEFVLVFVPCSLDL